MRLTDAAPAVLMLGLSVVIVTATLSLGVWDGFTPGPAFFPILIALFASVLALQLLVRAFRATADEACDWPDPAVLRTVGSVYGTLIAFFVVTPYLGMVPAIVGFLLIVMVGILRQPLIGSVVAASVTTGLIYLVFVLWLALPLPRGIIGL